MQEIDALAHQVNDILGRYIGIHDDLFRRSLRRSLRRILPIPGLFQAIEFAPHAEQLSVLLSELTASLMTLEKLTAQELLSPQHEAFLLVLQEYAYALRETISRLNDICNNLWRKSQGVKGYSLSMYNQDVAAYKASVQKYMEFGRPLNWLYANL